ncbi:hypothetical protein [Marinobacter shengliensis]|uniref:hypothetical protein n=1 Tax=Marinobacter shengliensis TaxID=1389223 RepID=UPI001108D5AB|nr:hypothetical protein [Marinobacter shengliensis]
MSNAKPILFKDEMIRAILEGRKTQTRRIVKGIDHDLLNMMSEDIVTGEPDSDLLELIYGPSTDDDGNQLPGQWMVRCIECPEEGVLTMGQGYGKPGDRLWVRETFSDEAGGTRKSPGEHIYYRADGDGVDLQGGGWTSSIHMPRWASRITLEITGVGVERLQDIGERDAEAEGARIELAEIDSVRLGAEASRRSGFRNLWQRINGPDSWYANPWVWVIEFRRIY